jgi:hypothetical protein
MGFAPLNDLTSELCEIERAFAKPSPYSTAGSDAIAWVRDRVNTISQAWCECDLTPSPHRNSQDQLPQHNGGPGPCDGAAEFQRIEGGLQEATYVAGAIAELIAHGRSPEDIAVLSRTRGSLDTLRTAFERAGAACSPSKLDRRAPPGPPSVKLKTLHSSKGTGISCGVRGGIGRARLQPSQEDRRTQAVVRRHDTSHTSPVA